LEKLYSDIKREITATSIENRKKYLGSNKKQPKKFKYIMDNLMKSLDDFTLKLLILVSILSISNKYNLYLIKVMETTTVDNDHKKIAWIDV